MIESNAHSNVLLSCKVAIIALSVIKYQKKISYTIFYYNIPPFTIAKKRWYSVMDKQQRIEIGQRLRQRRQELGLTREKMSELADIGSGY